MAMQIFLSTVKNELRGFEEETGLCAKAMSNINEQFIAGSESEWNTPAAARFIDGVCSGFNDYISQFNQKYQDEVDSFVEGVNVLARNEEATLVPNYTVERLSELSRSWAEQPEDFNIPEDFAGFTESNLTSNIKDLITHIDSMQTHIDNAVNNGLSSDFCINLKTSLNGLKETAKEVAESYNKTTAENAVTQDENISTIKSNT